MKKICGSLLMLVVLVGNVVADEPVAKGNGEKKECSCKDGNQGTRKAGKDVELNEDGTPKAQTKVGGKV